MKRSLFVLLVLFVVVSGAIFAQEWTSYAPVFDEGDIAVQAGLGLGTSFYGNTSIPPISVSVDYAMPIADLPFSFGGFVGFARSSYSWVDLTYILIGARASYHVDFNVENLDTYAGIMLGYNIVNANYESSWYSSYYSNAYPSYFLAGGYVGARYFFTDNIAAFGELGYGLGILTLGATMTF